MVMTGGVSTETVRGWYEAWNRRDWAAIEGLLAEPFVCEDIALGRVIRGKRDYLRYAHDYARAFPDGVVRVDRILGGGRNGEPVVVEYRGVGTQDGHFTLFPPSHRRVEIRYCDILRFENGRLVRCRTYVDLYGPLSRLGHITSARRAA